MDADEAFAIWYAPKIKFFLGRTIERSHHKAFKAAPGAADFEDLQLVDEEGHFFHGSVDDETQKSRVADLLFLDEFPLGIGFETCVEDLLHLRMLLQIGSDLHGIFLVHGETGRQSPDAADYEPGLHGSDDAAVECALLLTNPFHEGFILGNQDAADDIAVAAKIFGHRVHDDIDAEIQGLLVVT